MAIKLSTPIKKENLAYLKAGEKVLLSGTIYVARDQAHKKGLNFGLKDQIIFYAGPTPAKPGKPIGVIGPTTSSRMDKFTPQLYDQGLAATIGKGQRSKEVIEAIKRNHAVYFVALGGAAALLSKQVVSSKIIAYPELGPEAILQLEVKDFPVWVAIDSQGKCVYKIRH